MGIRATNNKSTKEQQYPLLKKGIRTGHIILFTAPGTGTMINPEEGTYTIGIHSTEWSGDAFEVYNGSITLENVNE